MIGSCAGIGDQVASDNGVDEDENDQRKQEKQADGRDVIENGPEGVGLRHATGRRSGRVLVGFQIVGQEQHGTVS